MKHIRQMLSVIRQYTSRREPAFRYLMKPDTKVTQLMHGIESGDFDCDEQAMNVLFSKDISGKRRYHSTKFILTEKLEMLFFFLHFRTPTVAPYTATLYKVKREVFVAEILEWTGKHDAMVRIASRALKSAREYHFTRFSIRCHEMLRDYYSLKGRRTEFNKHHKAIIQLLDQNNAETNASGLRARMKLEFSSQLTVSPATIRDFKSELPQLKADRNRFQTRSLELYYMRFAGAVKRLTGEFEKAQNIYQSYLEFLDKHPQFDLASHRFITHYHISRCHYFALEYDLASESILAALNHEPAGTENWFMGIEKYLLISLHSQNYQKAAELFRWALAQSRFRSNEIRIEKWSIYEAFLRFFVADKEVLPLHETVRGSSFQLNFILEELSITRLDHTGMYLAILVFQILHFLRRRLFDLLDSRIKTMQSLMYKIQRNRNASGGYYRTEILVSMITLMRKCDYHPSDTEEKTAPLYRHLVEYKQEDSSEESLLPMEEIIPYQHIWDFILREVKTIEKERAIV